MLYVDPRGTYAQLPDVELWDEARDARTYPGPHPVVAHPPCSRWCRLAGLVEARWGHRRGDDGGTFAAALAAVQRWGGVLEHPAWSDAWSDAWAAHGLAQPLPWGWQRDLWGGWVCHVEQHRYGHAARKGTWLYAVLPSPPPLRWSYTPDNAGGALVSWCRYPHDKRPRVAKRAASSTPLAFAEQLVAMARSAQEPGILVHR